MAGRLTSFLRAGERGPRRVGGFAGAPGAGGARRRGVSPGLGSVTGLGWIALATAGLSPFRGNLNLASPSLVLVLAVVVAGVLGGPRAAALTAVAAAAALNLVFIRPYGELKVAAWDDWIALGAFLAVAMAVGLLVASEAERRRTAEAQEIELRALYDRLNDATETQDRLREELGRIEVLERVDEQRSALLRSVSHDLRTPLATIRAVTSDLQDGVAYDDETRADLLATVSDEAERLDRIVTNLLSLSRIEAGALIPARQAVDVAELVGERMRRLTRLFERVRIQVDIAADIPLADGDYTQLDLVLTNLLENAARYAPTGSTVRIGGRRLGAMVEISVADEGIGVPDWERQRVFEAFRRGEGSRSSGVGLAICKGIVEAHGGTIRVERTTGGGATFLLTLPARE